MSAGRDVRQNKDLPEKRAEEETIMSSLFGLMMKDSLADLEDIEEPSAAELAALEAMAAEGEPLELTEAIQPPLSILNKLEEPGTAPPDRRAEEDSIMPSLLGLVMGDALADLEDIEEPSAAELAAMDAMAVEDEPLELPEAIQPPLSMLNSLEEPELVSFEGLDDADDIETIEEDLVEEDELLEDLLDNYADQDTDDDDIEDEGYDLDDDDIDHYQDLYGDDGDIIPSFREGETDDEDESDIAYYDDLR